jgi:hypothetical protein
MRARRVAALVAAVALVVPAAAPAHEGNPNFKSELDGIVPAIPGVAVEVLNFDDSLHLTNQSDAEVVVEGYEGEPYLRIAANGTVELNRRSPAYWLNDDRFGESDVPASADPGAAPDWELVDRSGSYSWHDHRIHWMSKSTPGQVSDESQRTKIFDYSIPIRAGGERASIDGTLFWVGEDSGFPVAPFVALAIVGGLAAAFLLIRRRSAGRDPNEEAW